MSENVNEILGVNNQNNAPKVDSNGNDTVDVPFFTLDPNSNSAEKMLNTIANIVLVCGIIASLICLLTICYVEDPRYSYIHRKIFNPTGFVATIMVFFSSLISWSFMRVLANISLTLKNIDKKTK